MPTIIEKLQSFTASVSITPVKRDPSPDALPTLVLTIEGKDFGEFDTYGAATAHLQMLIEEGE